MFEIDVIGSFLLLGAFVGFAAGLFGIGGGGIIVPMLTGIFLNQGMAINTVVPLALGTSMAAIIFTSLSSLRAHNAKKGILWPVVMTMLPGILLGTFASTFVASKVDAFYLALFFALFMTYVSMKMLFSKTAKPDPKISNTGNMFLAGSGIGAISALVSIGGGSLTVPYLTGLNVEIKKAIGTSAAIGLPISVAGTLGYLIHGWNSTPLTSYAVGYIYLPAVLLMSITSFLTAPYGVKMAYYLPVPILKKVFAILLIFISFKMFISILD